MTYRTILVRLGGVTRHMMQSMTVPVLISHQRQDRPD